MIGHCRGCGRALDRNAKTCPKCGLSNPVRGGGHFVTWVVALLVAIGAVSALVLTLQAPDQPSVKPAAETQPQVPDQPTNVAPTPATPAVPVAPEAPVQGAAPGVDQYDGLARRVAEAYIRGQLEVPQSAEFSIYDETEVSLLPDGPPNQRLVQGYVTSKDILGTTTRKRYEVVIEFGGGKPPSYSVVSSVMQ